ncbi:MAG: OmpA family protein [Rhizobiales bacterium]|nr:OmpA family protein [Hyphomicrobiales bacterium]
MKSLVTIFLGVALALYTLPLSASDVSQEDIVCKLDPNCAKTKKPLTRSLSRGISSSGGAPEQGPPSVDLYVNFAYDSADLTSDARITLNQLGGALRDPRLEGFAFMIEGHTDAKGSAEYNQKLSERRAAAVRQYLIAQFGLAPARLSSVGYGKSRLLRPDQPEDGVNRRVRVVNTTATSQR